MNKNNGWISLHRKIIDSPIWYKPSEWTKIWIYLLLEVNHKTGEGFFIWEIIQNECKVSKGTLKSCLKFMEKEKMISREKLPRGVKITILNWSNYQNKSTRPSTNPSTRPSTNPSTRPSEINQKVSINDDSKDNKSLNPPIKSPINLPIKSEDILPIHNTISNNNLINKDYNINIKQIKKDNLLNTDNIPKHKKEKEEIDNVYFNFVKKFAEMVNITLDRGFINKNIRHAKNLLKQYQEQEIIDIIHWRLNNDSDGYYQKYLTNLGFVYSHIAEWIKLKNIPKMTVEEFLKKNPNLDWREIDDKVVRYETFFKTFKIMKNNPNVLIDDEMWDKYKRMHRKYLDVLKGDE